MRLLGSRNIGELDFENDGVVRANGFENPKKLALFATGIDLI